MTTSELNQELVPLDVGVLAGYFALVLLVGLGVSIR